MGSCATSKALSNDNSLKHINNSRGGSSKMIEQSDREKQILCLKLIYNDLASRSKSNNLNGRNFQMFFHLNWVLGGSLFRKFSTMNRSWLSEKQFVSGIFQACDLNQENRIKFMFTVLDMNLSKGLSYCELIGLLLSSPHQCLIQILKNEQFLDALGFSQLYSNIISSKKQGQISSNNFSLFPSLKYKQYHDQDCQKIKKHANNFKTSLNETQLVKQSKDTLKKLLKQKIDQNLYSTKLITKYAEYIFQNFKIDREKGELKLNQFRKIVYDNPIIFKSYYSGFHEYLWRHQGGFPLYKSIQPFISDYCIEKRGNIVRNVYLVFIKTSIMIFQCNKMRDPLSIKNLQGLEIKSIQSHEGFGFTLYHNNSNYQTISYYFEDKLKQEEWIEALNQFGSANIERKYKIKQKIGTETHSQVHQCIDKETNQRYAVKIIRKGKQNQPCFRYLQCQSQILAFCTHESILKVKQRYETSKNIYLIMELLDSVNLLNYIQSQNRTSLLEEDAKLLMKQLLQATSRIHSLGILHRDLKFENVLMKNQNGKIVPKIIDFGTAIFKMHIPLMQEQMKYVGTQLFRAPEIDNKLEYDEKIDVYSLGVMMFFMLIGRSPFDSALKKSCKIEYSEVQSRKLSSKAKDLLKLLLCDKTKRLSCEQALRHKWFS